LAWEKKKANPEYHTIKRKRGRVLLGRRKNHFRGRSLPLFQKRDFTKKAIRKKKKKEPVTQWVRKNLEKKGAPFGRKEKKKSRRLKKKKGRDLFESAR